MTRPQLAQYLVTNIDAIPNDSLKYVKDKKTGNEYQPFMRRLSFTLTSLSKATLLRVSDVMRLKQADIFNSDGSIKQNAFIHDRKTGKPNTLYLKTVQTELLLYRQWLLDHQMDSEWLFPFVSNHAWNII